MLCRSAGTRGRCDQGRPTTHHCYYRGSLFFFCFLPFKDLSLLSLSLHLNGVVFNSRRHTSEFCEGVPSTLVCMGFGILKSNSSS